MTDKKNPVDAMLEEARKNRTPAPVQLPRPTGKRSPYSPRTWPIEHRVALAIATIVGASLGLAIGYATVGVDYSFEYWAWGSSAHYGQKSMAFGAAIGVAVVYLVKLLR